MVGMMQALGALPIVGPGAVAAGADPTWGPTASSDGGSRLARGEPRDPRALRRGARRTRDAEAAGALVDADAFVDHSPGWGTRELRLRARRRSATLRARDARPDATSSTRSNMVCEGNEVAATRSSAARTPARRSSAPSRPATRSSGRTATSSGSTGGKIVERWTATDMLTLFQQAGVLPSMGG